MEVKSIPIESLKPHSRNYRSHPKDQLAHIKASIERHGFYRNIVCSDDLTVLAGHGVMQASKELGIKEVPVIVLPIKSDSPEAIKVMVADNQLGHFAEDDDRLLADLLKEIDEFDVDGLIGTGYDEMMLSNLVLVTRPETEVEDQKAADEWTDMPEHETADSKWKLIFNCDSEESRDELMETVGVHTTSNTNRKTVSVSWPNQESRDVKSIRFVDEGDEAES